MSPGLDEESTANFNGSLKLKQHWLGEENLSGFETNASDFALQEFGFFCSFVE